jgi:2,3-bisphosphoglycerate-independent phosphoglycerate mutase
VTGPAQSAVILIVDGLGDLPVAGLDGQTPLEAAETPVLDRMAAVGQYGLVDPILPGEIPNTDSGVGLLLGLPPDQAGTLHRGPVEAAGAGRWLGEGEIAVRANFATVEEGPDGLLVTDRRAGRAIAHVDELAQAIDGMDLGDGIRAEFRPTDQHRGVLVLSGPGLDDAVSDTDPGDGVNPAYLRPSRPLRPSAGLAAAKINRFTREAHRRLDRHPVNRARKADGKPLANGIITRGAGSAFQPVCRLEKLGLRAAVIAGCNTVLGLARLFGLEAVHKPGFTAALDTDLEGKISAALSALDDHDLAYIHVKASDLCAHDRKPLAKRDFLERLDSALEPLLSCGAVVALSSDHTTDSNTGAHTADPVPSLIFDPSAIENGDEPAVKFGETACRQGTLPRLRSFEFLDRILEKMGCPPA